SMGTASHALGTARCAELEYQAGAFGSLGRGLWGQWRRRVQLYATVD
ncbi:LrgB family protein, partial [Klebsiella pneumoniae]